MPGRLDFKQLALDIDVEQVADWLGLKLTNKANNIRTECPTCGGDDRTLQIFPETNSFRCYKAEISGDVISFYGHCRNYTGMYRAAKELAEHFHTADAAGSPTAPQKPVGRTQPATAPKKELVFDPASFASKLTYVPDLGISEEEATRLGIGEHRGKLYIALRDDFGHTAGFVAVEHPKFPKTLLKNEGVVKLKRA